MSKLTLFGSLHRTYLVQNFRAVMTKTGYAATLCGIALQAHAGAQPAACARGIGAAIAEAGDIHAGVPIEGATPFIYKVPLQGTGVRSVDQIVFGVEPAIGAVSSAVKATYSMSYLAARGDVDNTNDRVIVPVFGLYAGSQNQVTITVVFRDTSCLDLAIAISTPRYTDPDGTYDHLETVVRRQPGTVLGYSYYYMKSVEGSPIIADTDGNIRWVGAGVPGGFSQTFTDNGFVIGSGHPPKIYRIDLDGTVTGPIDVQSVDALDFSHDINTSSPMGLMGEFDVSVRGQKELRSTAVEFDPFSGAVFNEWNIDDIVSRHMSRHGDDPSLFVRPDEDWFHMNEAIYDATDRSVIVSSRENFVMKFDYDTGEIKWIFGDPSKYWYQFSSLRAKALTMVGGGLVPAGQHDISIAPDGTLLLFNDGTPSFKQPRGEPAGVKRKYSAVTAYAIDAASRTVTQVWDFDYGKSLLTRLCGSAAEMPDGSILADFPQAEDRLAARIVGLDASHRVVFDHSVPNKAGCDTAWNAQPIALESLSFL